MSRRRIDPHALPVRSDRRLSIAADAAAGRLDCAAAPPRRGWARFHIAVALAVLAPHTARAEELAKVEDPAPVADVASAAGPALSPQPLRAQIDALISAALTIPAASRSSDAEFVRRVYLDLTNMVPSSADAKAFLDDPGPDKRERLIDRLLASPQFARRLQNFYDLMFMERRPEKNVSLTEWREFLRQSAAENKPFDRLVREILSADGADPQHRAAAKFFLDRDADANLLTRDVGRIFLGVDLQCAQCHDHPLINDYEQQHYYGLFAFLNRTYAFTEPKKKQVLLAEKAEGEVVYKSVFAPEQGERKTTPHMPADQPMAEPAFEDGHAYFTPPADGVRPAPKFSRRAQLASHLIAAPREEFTRNIANRLWALLLGRGLVHPVDLHHGDNPASHPELLQALSHALAAMNFDVRAFLRELANSQTYQRSSELPIGVSQQAATPESYAVGPLRQLSPEQLAWSVMMSVGVVTNYRTAAENETASDKKLAELLSADAALQSVSDELVERRVYQQLASYETTFVSLYGGQPGASADPQDATIHQALFFANGSLIQTWVAPFGGGLVDRLNKTADANQAAEELYLSVLARRPEPEELAEVRLYLDLRPGDQRAAAIQELVWGVLASAEFRMNH